MHISDFALYRVTWNRRTPWPLKILGGILNYASIIIGLAVASGAVTAGVALGWKWFS